VGSRRVSEYGRRVTEELVFELASRGITIISGFMYGVDALAHKTAIAADGKTVAVVAYGIERACLGYMGGLYEDILNSGGLVVSEYGSDEPARKFMFPKRNRIIAGLSMATLVVEAGLKSGSLITAGYAAKYDRAVLAVPGSIYNNNSKGTNGLVLEGKATMITGVKDVLNVFELVKGPTPSRLVSGQGGLQNSLLTQNSLLGHISKEFMTRDEICKATKLPISELNQKLTLLTLSGQVIERGGKYRANCG